jgi:hopanoid biosynthesis associated protein HpnK
MLRLIVHADDFGLTECINEGVVVAHRDGVLTSASVMANGAAFEHATQLARATPTLDVGIHLVLVAERPLLPAADIPSLMTEDGTFPGHATALARRYLLGRIRLDEVRAELAAQIERVLAAGLRPSHLDSHQHTHMLPGIRRVVVELAQRYRIPAMREPVEALRSYMLRTPAGWVRAAQAQVLRLLALRAASDPTWHADHFVGFFEGGRLDRVRLRRLLAHLPSMGTCELMCHPGRADPASPYGHWGYRWHEELEALSDPGLVGLLRERGVRLASYRDCIAQKPTGATPFSGVET